MREKSEMTLREAAQQALEALEDSHQNINPERGYADELARQIADAITVLRAALAEEQNYVNRWISVEENLPKEGQLVLGLYYKSNISIVYRQAREIDGRWVIEDWVEPSSGHSFIPPTHWTPLPEYEHVHKMESNPTINEMETVEPMAWLHEWEGVVSINMTPPKFYGDHWKHTPLYTAPPKREPLLIERNEFIGDPPAPAKTWGEYFENVVTTSRLSGLRVSALTNPVAHEFAGVKITEVRLPENMAMRLDGDVLVIERAHGIGGEE